MRRLTLPRTAIALVAVLAVGCASSSNKRPGSDESPPSSCSFSAALAAAEAVEPKDRVAPILAGLSTACDQYLGDLAKVAGSAQTLERSARAKALGEAASSALPAACAADDALAPASNLAWSCPAPAEMELADELMADLDSGSYLFVLAVRARLASADKLDDTAVKLLDNLALAAALEGEAAGKPSP